MSEPGDYREPEGRTTVVTTDGGSGAGMIAGIVIAIAAVAVVLFLFGGNFAGDGVDPTPTAGIEAPKVDAPAAPDVDVDVPNPDVDVEVNPPANDSPSE